MWGFISSMALKLTFILAALSHEMTEVKLTAITSNLGNHVGTDVKPWFPQNEKIQSKSL